MKPQRQGLYWSIFLLFASVFLLLKNLGVFDPWGEVAWGGLFAVAGLGFLIWFLFDFQRWWRAIPGFTLLSIGALVLLQWRGVDLGYWSAALLLFGMALGFWVVLLVHGENWWAVIPAGVLTVLGVLLGLRALSELVWMTAFFIGLGLVFGLLYLLHPRQPDTRWAAIPAAALVLFGLVTLFAAINAPLVVKQWWPALLLAVGVGLLIGALGLGGRHVIAPPAPEVPAPDYEAIEPAAGTSLTETLPEVVTEPPQPQPEPQPEPEPPAAPEPSPAPATEEASGDIYEILAQQPPEPEPSGKPAADT